MDTSTSFSSGVSGRGEPVDRPLSAVEIELNQKRELRDAVRHRFARYGQTVCDLLLDEVQKPRGLHTLILQLGLRVSANTDNMLTSLSHYLALHGGEALIARVRGGMVRPELSGQIPLEPEVQQASPHSAAPLSGVIPPAPRGVPAADIARGYTGPERRCGEERRQANRRNELEAIMKNRRYGADRRQQQRRHADRAR